MPTPVPVHSNKQQCGAHAGMPGAPSASSNAIYLCGPEVSLRDDALLGVVAVLSNGCHIQAWLESSVLCGLVHRVPAWYGHIHGLQPAVLPVQNLPHLWSRNICAVSTCPCKELLRFDPAHPRNRPCPFWISLGLPPLQSAPNLCEPAWSRCRPRLPSPSCALGPPHPSLTCAALPGAAAGPARYSCGRWWQ